MRSQYTPETIEKFWNKVDKSGECWTWTGGVTSHGYGTFYLGNKTYIRAHRFAFLVSFGWLLDDGVVAHKCDNPSCVNPSHLMCCTRGENIRDRDRKGRQDHGPNAPRWTPPPPKGPAKGSRAGRSKLTEDQVRAIRAEYCPGHTGRGYRALAKKYGVTGYAIEMVVKRKSWCHV